MSFHWGSTIKTIDGICHRKCNTLCCTVMLTGQLNGVKRTWLLKHTIAAFRQFIEFPINNTFNTVFAFSPPPFNPYTNQLLHPPTFTLLTRGSYLSTWADFKSSWNSWCKLMTQPGCHDAASAWWRSMGVMTQHGWRWTDRSWKCDNRDQQQVKQTTAVRHDKSTGR